jgi:hypothetical protein
MDLIGNGIPHTTDTSIWVRMEVLLGQRRKCSSHQPSIRDQLTSEFPSQLNVFILLVTSIPFVRQVKGGFATGRQRMITSYSYVIVLSFHQHFSSFIMRGTVDPPQNW